LENWPQYNEKFIKTEEYILVIQVNGKMRDKIMVSKKIDRSQIEKLALGREAIKKYIANKEIKKIVFVPDKLINIVI